MKLPVWHVQHQSLKSDSPLKAGTPGCELKDIAKPMGDEPLFLKNVNSAFIGTNLESCLRAAQLDTVVIVGLTTDHCVSTSARMAANLGFNAFVVSDATATFNRVGQDGSIYSAQDVHNVALASLHNEFAVVCTTWDIMQRLAVWVVNDTYKTIEKHFG